MLNKYDLRYKKFLRLERELDEVSTKLFNSDQLVELDEPYQRGWYYFYDLRDDIKRRKDAPIIMQALELGYSINYTRNVAIVRAIRAGKESYRGKNGKTISLDAGRFSVSEDKFKKLDKNVAKYFWLDDVSELFKKRNYKLYYVNLPRHWMVLKVKPNIITHVLRRRGGELESQYTKLRNSLMEFWHEKYNYSKSYPVGKDRTYMRAEIQKVKKGEADDILVKGVKWEYEY